MPSLPIDLATPYSNAQYIPTKTALSLLKTVFSKSMHTDASVVRISCLNNDIEFSIFVSSCYAGYVSSFVRLSLACIDERQELSGTTTIRLHFIFASKQNKVP